MNYLWPLTPTKRVNGLITSKDGNGTSSYVSSKSSPVGGRPEMVKEQLAPIMERQRGNASIGTSQVHPHYAKDDDHHPSLDLHTHNM